MWALKAIMFKIPQRAAVLKILKPANLAPATMPWLKLHRRCMGVPNNLTSEFMHIFVHHMRV